MPGRPLDDDAGADAAIADAVLAAADAARSIPPFTAGVAGFDLARGYRVGAAVARRREARGERIVGWKIGFTNTTIWDRYGVHAPIWSPVYDRTLRLIDDSGAAEPCALAGLVEPRIEPEVVLRFARAPRAGMEEDEILDCVDAVAHGMEIVQSLYPGWRFAAPDTVAAFGLHGRLLCGPRIPVGTDRARWRRDLAGFGIALSRDGVAVAEGTAADVLGGPLSACRHFLDGLAAEGGFPRGVAAGDLVTTGTVTDAFPVAAGDTWTTRVSGLGGVSGMAIRFA